MRYCAIMLSGMTCLGIYYTSYKNTLLINVQIQCASQLKCILTTSWKCLYSEMLPKFCELQELKARDLEPLKLLRRLLWDFGFSYVLLWLSLYYKVVI